MTWNYLEGTEQRGPISEADFNALVNSGTITDQTYVWREGMAEWLPYGTVRAGEPALAATPGVVKVTCAECGQSFAQDQVIRHGNVYICANCKPVFLQKIREGVSVSGGFNYAGFWVRGGAKVLDGIIVGLLGYAGGMVVGLAAAGGSHMVLLLLGQLVGISLSCIYYTFFVGKFGATPGKMAAKLLVINPDGSKVSFAKAFGRFFAAEYISGFATLTIGYIIAGSDAEKRALHDRICRTRVIRK